ncbi:hypothetical protein LX16_2186 [Stackebrandtia albiflava]|uniref:Uncharacterized protein n=1 Tax=Stackebrandtia albiflava TaxID=406432 RepID=A0A562V0P9_9ACTN|nr:hypothetical protein [Stackebrandtia albiflava]TWJ11464.1 hypothetical protein LX16_2186 [Stackebrandtia albiflava]
MAIRSCSYEILIPGADPAPPAPVHPDPHVNVVLTAVARAARTRRFAFVQTRVTEDRVDTGLIIHGVENPDGTAVVLAKDGHPFGWFTTVDSAHARMPLPDMYLVWLDPERDPDLLKAADAETTEQNVDVWLMALPFAALGLADARARALDILACLEDTVPGMLAESAGIFEATRSTSFLTLYCPEPGCTLSPYHSGDHHIPTTPTDGADLAPTAEPVYTCGPVETEAECRTAPQDGAGGSTSEAER